MFARIPALVVLVLLTLAALVLAWIDPTALCALPALILPLLLVVRRYPGERVLVVLALARRRRRRRSLRSIRPVVRAAAVLPRGGLLLASSLAVRPPPPLA